jgi:hypothetical protein
MAQPRARPISVAERIARQRKVTQVARGFGFVGRIEYRHVQSRAGGAQYAMNIAPENDLLVDHTDAFERDADPEDFSLEAIIAHERGHHLLARQRLN